MLTIPVSSELKTSNKQFQAKGLKGNLQTATRLVKKIKHREHSTLLCRLQHINILPQTVQQKKCYS